MYITIGGSMPKNHVLILCNFGLRRLCTMSYAWFRTILALCLWDCAIGRPRYNEEMPNGRNVVHEGAPWPGVGHNRSTLSTTNFCLINQ